MGSVARAQGSLPAWTLGREVVYLFTCENAWKRHLCTRVPGQTRRRALSNPVPPSHTTTSGAGTGAISASRTLEASARAMYHDTTRPPSCAMSTTRSRASQIPSTKSTRWTSPVGSGMGQTRQNPAVLLLNVRPWPGIESWVPFDVSHARNSCV